MSISVIKKKSRKAIPYDGSSIEKALAWSAISPSGADGTIQTLHYADGSFCAWVAVSLIATQEYTSNYGGYENKVELYDAEGTKVAESNFGWDDEQGTDVEEPLSYTPVTGGTYYLKFKTDYYDTEYGEGISVNFSPRPADPDRPLWMPWETSGGLNAAHLPVKYNTAEEAGIRFDGTPIAYLDKRTQALRKALNRLFSSWTTVSTDSLSQAINDAYHEDGGDPLKEWHLDSNNGHFNPVWHNGRQAIYLPSEGNYLTMTNEDEIKSVAFSFCSLGDGADMTGGAQHVVLLRVPYIQIGLSIVRLVNFATNLGQNASDEWLYVYDTAGYNDVNSSDVGYCLKFSTRSGFDGSGFVTTLNKVYLNRNAVSCPSDAQYGESGDAVEIASGFSVCMSVYGNNKYNVTAYPRPYDQWGQGFMPHPNGLCLPLNGGTVQYGYVGSGNAYPAYHTNPPRIDNGQWHGIVATRDGAYVKIFYDGKLVYEYTLPSTYLYDEESEGQFGENDKRIYIGGEYSGYARGYFGADMRFFNQPLSDSNAARLSRSMSRGYFSSPITMRKPFAG